MKLSLERIKTVAPLWLLVSAVMMVFMYGTSPDSIGPQGITVFFVVAYLFVATTIQLVALFLRRTISRPGPHLRSWRPLYSLALAFLPVVAVGLDSLDQLILRDILIFVALGVLVVFYLSKQGEDN